jgi:charged multivesicular body protein 1
MSLNELQNLQFNLKFVAKQFAKNSTKCEKEEKQEVSKCKQAMQKGNMEGARIYAQNSIRKKSEALNHLRLAARMDAVASRLDTAVKMQMVTKSMGAMVKGMDKVLTNMNPEAISRLMDTFEKQFETLDVTSEYMETAIGQTTATSTPEDEVNTLMSQVADEHGLDIKQHLDSRLTVSQAAVSSKQSQHDPETEELERRLAALGKSGK